MAATYRMGTGPAARVAQLSRWGPWQAADRLLAEIPEVAGGRVVLVGDVRCGGLAALGAGASDVCAALDTPDGAALALSVVACRELPRASAAALFGEDAFGRRVWFYHHVRGGLPTESRAFWDAHERTVRLGLCTSAGFEQRLARVSAVWKLGRGRRRAQLQAEAVAAAWGGADLDSARLVDDTVWTRALRAGRPPGLTEGLHSGARRGTVTGEVGPGDVVWLGDALDRSSDPHWTALAPVAVGWTVRERPVSVPSGWTLQEWTVDRDCPLVRARFVLRRGRMV